MNKVARLFLAIAICSCSDVDQLDMLQSSIDRAQFDTSTSIPANPAPAVNANVTLDAARKVYADILALPEQVPGTYNCPADFGVTYQIVFYEASEELATAAMTPTGCGVVTLTSKTSSAVLTANPDFWTQLSTDLGITEAQIYPYQPPTR